MAFKKGDRVKFKIDGDQWAYMQDMKIQKVNKDGTYDVVGKNPQLTRLYKTEYCSALRVKEHNLERDSDE
jgi:hypothetical protein